MESEVIDIFSKINRHDSVHFTNHNLTRKICVGVFAARNLDIYCGQCNVTGILR